MGNTPLTDADERAVADSMGIRGFATAEHAAQMERDRAMLIDALRGLYEARRFAPGTMALAMEKSFKVLAAVEGK